MQSVLRRVEQGETAK